MRKVWGGLYFPKGWSDGTQQRHFTLKSVETNQKYDSQDIRKWLDFPENQHVSLSVALESFSLIFALTSIDEARLWWNVRQIKSVLSKSEM